LIRRVVTPVQNAANLADNARRRLPQHILQMAEGRVATLRYLGEVERDGKKASAVAFAGPTGTQFVLLFDSQTNLLTAWETMSSDPLFGDVTNETIFTGYTEAGGIQWPTGQMTKTGGVVTQDVRYSDWKMNAQPAAAAFEPPADFASRPAPARPSGITVNQVARDVYLMEGLGGGGYRVLFVAFRDFILVVEAPQNEAVSRAAIQKIRETVPGKPIRYIAVTHHHDDHAGGVRSYMAEGAAIVTTPGNLPYFRRSLSAPFTIAPDSYAKNRPQVIGDAIQNKKAVFTDSVQVVELLDIGPSPHAQEFLVAWLPEHKILFQGDLHTDVNGGRGSETLAHFAEWIEKMKLPVEKILGVHGPAAATLADLQQAVAQFKAAK
jgi:glyoxylase-like metal-dependent hydrolase (beta-lactamase superfamily II)